MAFAAPPVGDKYAIAHSDGHIIIPRMCCDAVTVYAFICLAFANMTIGGIFR
jgi:hypothetical protein